ncbi:pterin-4-alpha-carbinolamine dehydratase [Cyanobacterium aponinum PCC 10605]|uniref:Putative pterin-4-alpha-carbinolamine dehydratase n=2 Tax=Cyanobacterium aponinum TaxID=379064 RepID=K9Z713_CYAAP|nr:pterin-4-alpha-carbinolamine dehydratase [Cyanobacterium aponinum PCC 10605]
MLPILYFSLLDSSCLTLEKSNVIIESKLIITQNMVLNETEVRQKLANYPNWVTSGQSINTTYKFKDFIQAVEFVNRLVEPAERAGHHPDIEISYNKVTIHLTTHDAGGITQKDFDLAEEIQRIIKGF